TDAASQVVSILERHEGEAAIVYCLSRRETESLAAELRASGFRAEHYHAGMSKVERDATQDSFAKEEISVIVATVAFGMGIDKSDVRCVVHASLPKSVEHYQQETGRAGRDGLPAECVLLYSAADTMKWEGLFARDAGEGEDASTVLSAQRELLGHMSGYGEILACRHRFLSRYFGQDYEGEDCGACDVCLGEVEPMPESTVVAQKILSCVARLGQRFGVGHVVRVLRGSDTETVRTRGHDRISTYGLLSDIEEKALTNLVYQLVGQGLLDRSAGDRPILRLSRDSAAVLKGERDVRLREPAARKVRRTRADAEAWEGVDRGLFEHLREVRRRLAAERGVPAYVIFDDRTLRGLARLRPRTLREMGEVRGIGEKKLADLGEIVLGEIEAHVDGE
ncbi:MAG: RQC domain-containing protein, partial [Planctomycetota bacterium]